MSTDRAVLNLEHNIATQSFMPLAKQPDDCFARGMKL